MRVSASHRRIERAAAPCFGDREARQHPKWPHANSRSYAHANRNLRRRYVRRQRRQRLVLANLLCRVRHVQLEVQAIVELLRLARDRRPRASACTSPRVRECVCVSVGVFVHSPVPASCSARYALMGATRADSCVRAADGTLTARTLLDAIAPAAPPRTAVHRAARRPRPAAARAARAANTRII